MLKLAIAIVIAAALSGCAMEMPLSAMYVPVQSGPMLPAFDVNTGSNGMVPAFDANTGSGGMFPVFLPRRAPRPGYIVGQQRGFRPNPAAGYQHVVGNRVPPRYTR